MRLMNEAVKHLEYHATSEDGYKLCRNYPNVRLSYYKKKHEGHTNIYKVKLKTYGSDKVSINEQYYVINQIKIKNCYNLYTYIFLCFH